MEYTVKNLSNQFIPQLVMSCNNVRHVKLLTENKFYEKYQVIVSKNEKDNEQVCLNEKEAKPFSKRIVKETYAEYLDLISKREMDKDQWIYNIIDGIDEQDRILYKDSQIIVVPTHLWDTKNISKLHILCLPVDKTLRTIRDLTAANISLLETMKQLTLKTIKDKYGLDEEDLKMFFHYDPSTYHLHIHFMNNNYNESRSSVEYSHDLDAVIFNLKMDSDYYKKINLNRRI